MLQVMYPGVCVQISLPHFEGLSFVKFYQPMKLHFSSTICLLYCDYVQNATRDRCLEYDVAKYSVFSKRFSL